MLSTWLVGGGPQTDDRNKSPLGASLRSICVASFEEEESVGVVVAPAK